MLNGPTHKVSLCALGLLALTQIILKALRTTSRRIAWILSVTINDIQIWKKTKKFTRVFPRVSKVVF